MRSFSIFTREVGVDVSRFFRLRATLRSFLTAANAVGLIGAALALGCLLTLPAPWNIRLPIYLILSVWVLLRPQVALYLLPLSVPWGALDYISLGSLRLNSTDILVILLAASWLAGHVLRSGDQTNGPRSYERQAVPPLLLVGLAVLLISMLASMTVAISVKSSVKEIFKWIEVLIVVVAGSSYIRTRRQGWTIVILSLVAALSQAALGYYQELFNIGPSSFVRGESLRVYGTFNQPNPYAGYINLSLPIALALTIAGSRKQTRWLAAGASVLLALAEFFSQSRGGWLALITASLFILLVGLPSLRPFWRVLIVGFGALVESILIGIIPQNLFIPLLNFIGVNNISFTHPSAQQYATAERLAHWLAGIHMFLDHPWLGVGIGNYGDAYPRYAIGIFVIPLGHAHNYFINVAAEMGLVGLIAYTFFVLVIAGLSARAYHRLRRVYRELAASLASNSMSVSALRWQQRLAHIGDDQALALGIVAALLTVLVHNMVDNLYVQGMTNLMALLLIVLLRLERLTLAEHQQQGQRESNPTQAAIQNAPTLAART
ncbi:MAG: O-antigen ligase family protein [Thermogemmatispora sp.]|jgi:O-antigen ligase|uniref:O-antigen ligase family protein n=1 Tax=Thermogemmatispora sp. TaxID=1968838 RepID=UPI001A051038|nr:O-antigen ligase family protein [Thermogemmatispora sp.]MBE3566463.1 O-antigen ligase family protein [Thermogemmatispora sp.]